MTVQAAAALDCALGELPERDRLIFIERAANGRSLAALAASLGVSRSRVDQIYGRTVDRLFFALLPWREDLLEGERSMARRGSGQSITKRQRETYIAALAGGATHEKAAQEAGRGRRLFLDLRQANETLRFVVDRAEELGNHMVEQQLVDIAFGKVEAKNTAQVTACFGLLRSPQARPVARDLQAARGRQAPAAEHVEPSDEELEVFRGLLAKVRGNDG